MEVVDEFCYLGANFSSSDLFLNAANRKVKRANAAFARVKPVIFGSRVGLHGSIRRLYEAAVLSVLMYNSEVWALRYPDIIEKVQVGFFNGLYFLDGSTPGYIVRGEFKLEGLEVVAFERSLNWMCRILAMPSSRLPPNLLRPIGLSSQHGI